MKTLIKYIVLAIILMVVAPNCFSQNAEDILTELSERTNSFNSIKVSFAYKMVNKDADINEVTNGTLLVSGDKYNINIAGQNVISDGSTLWTYIPDSQEVQINEVSEDEGFSPSKLLSSYNDSYSSSKMDNLTINGKTYYQLKLNPKDKNSNFDYVILIINKELMQLSNFIMYDYENNEFSYEIKQFITDESIPETSFSFNPADYPDVEVIDMR